MSKKLKIGEIRMHSFQKHNLQKQLVYKKDGYLQAF